MTRLAERLRQGIDPNDIPDAEAIMDTAADELDDLRKANALLHALVENRDAEIARLRAALEKITDPLTLDVEGIGMHRALLIIRRVQEIAQKALGDAESSPQRRPGRQARMRGGSLHQPAWKANTLGNRPRMDGNDSLTTEGKK